MLRGQRAKAAAGLRLLPELPEEQKEGENR